MKVRNGFVSNSSSSSFIISSNRDDGLYITVRAKLPYQDKITSVEEWKAWFLDYYGYENNTFDAALEEDHYLAKKWHLGLDELSKGNTLYTGDVSSEDYNGIGEYLYSSGFGDVVEDEGTTVIESD